MRSEPTSRHTRRSAPATRLPSAASSAVEANGATDANGENGENGENGANGANGENGANGANGATGENGAAETTGPTSATAINTIDAIEPSAATASPLLAVEGLVKHYTLPRERLFATPPRVEALRGVSFSIEAGASLGLVGESGSGKSTLARLVMALETPTAGRVTLLGRDLSALAPAALRAARRDFQMVFQDPYGSLDPRQRVGRIVAEPLGVMPGADARARVADALEAVGLRPGDAAKYPHEFSGGQRQRIAIARALITRPRLIVADEPVSALDVSVQAQVLNLLQDLQQQFGVTYLLISHDLAVVDHLCAEVAVLYAGRIVEQGAPERLFRAAAHPYTRALLDAVPQPQIGMVRRQPHRANGVGPSIRVAPEIGRDGAGDSARDSGSETDSGSDNGSERDSDMAAWGSDGATCADAATTAAEPGCAYAPRCAYRRGLCVTAAPALRVVAGGHLAACHFAEQVMIEVNAEEEST